MNILFELVWRWPFFFIHLHVEFSINFLSSRILNHLMKVVFSHSFRKCSHTHIETKWRIQTNNFVCKGYDWLWKRKIHFICCENLWPIKLNDAFLCWTWNKWPLHTHTHEYRINARFNVFSTVRRLNECENDDNIYWFVEDYPDDFHNDNVSITENSLFSLYFLAKLISIFIANVVIEKHLFLLFELRHCKNAQETIK